MLKFEEIISKFQIEGEITDVKPLGHGTVNHTYEIVCGGEHYVLQEMNHIEFKSDRSHEQSFPGHRISERCD